MRFEIFIIVRFLFLFTGKRGVRENEDTLAGWGVYAYFAKWGGRGKVERDLYDVFRQVLYACMDMKKSSPFWSRKMMLLS